MLAQLTIAPFVCGACVLALQGAVPTGRFVATNLAVLINASGTGTRPVRNLSIVGIEFRDTRATFMDPHGLPSG